MNILKDMDGKLVIAGLGALAVIGSFIVGLIAYWVMEAAGMNDSLAAALSMVVWVAVVGAGMIGVVSFYNKSGNNRVEQVTVIREVIVPPQIAPEIAPEIQPVEPMPRPFLDEPSHLGTPSTNYRAMLLEGNEPVEPETPRSPNNPESSKPLN